MKFLCNGVKTHKTKLNVMVKMKGHHKRTPTKSESSNFILKYIQSVTTTDAVRAFCEAQGSLNFQF